MVIRNSKSISKILVYNKLLKFFTTFKVHYSIFPNLLFYKSLERQKLYDKVILQFKKIKNYSNIANSKLI